MIRLAEAGKELICSADTPFGCRIRSLAAAYGVGEPFARFWVQDGGSAVAELDDAAILEERDSDPEELAEFLRALDVKTLSCAEPAAERLGLPVAARGEILLRRGAVPGDAGAGTERDPDLREIHALLRRAAGDGFAPPEFEPFYMDLSHRIRHGAAAAAGIRLDGELTACALCPSMTERSAVVSAVAVAPEHRREGLGRAVLAALTAALARERVYVFRTDGHNEEFYRSLGFQPCGRWAEVRFEGGKSEHEGETL